MIIRTRAYPRAGLIGNPSDGYYGKTIAFVFSNFCAEVTLYQTPEIEILPNLMDHSRFESIKQLDENVGLYGYYGGIRLLKASVKRFYNYCRENSIELDDRNFTIRYSSDIPHRVGLAGSSAIITACFRALMSFYSVSIPAAVLANLVLSVEVDELNIPAGLQDRVVQAYEGMVYMDFGRELMEKQGHGKYEPLDPQALPPIYIAYREDLSEGTEVFHNDIRSRFDRGEPEVTAAMKQWAGLTDELRIALRTGDHGQVAELINRNFDLRRTLYKISEGNNQMVEAARSVGASAKFSGSGGAIVGTYKDDAMFAALREHLEPRHIRVLKPHIVEQGEHHG
jgi:glucuronokinase